ncbi:hypothetical protein ATCC90586_000689 [Pythium insidiosum]|nr:hypothetical protein ATCC90586_000689 [Pythium insidiosum]
MSDDEATKTEYEQDFEDADADDARENLADDTPNQQEEKGDGEVELRRAEHATADRVSLPDEMPPPSPAASVADVNALSEDSPGENQGAIVSLGWFFLDLRTPDLPERWVKLQNSPFGGEILDFA